MNMTQAFSSQSLRSKEEERPGDSVTLRQDIGQTGDTCLGILGDLGTQTHAA